MIDIQLIRDHPDKVIEAAAAKGIDRTLAKTTVNEILRLDNQRRDLLSQTETLRAERNKLNKDDRARGVAIKKQLKDIEPQLKQVENNLFNDLLLRIPNPAAPDVKIGTNDTQNDIVKTWGQIPKFGFTPKDHLELGEALDIIDVKRAGTVSGSRFTYLKGDAVLLEFALVRLAMDMLIKEGFIPVIPPVIIKKSSMAGMGYLEHGGEADMYVLDKDDQVLIGTSEQALGPMHSGEIFAAKDLPRRYAGFSTCFRREAGSYGKDTRGILRLHQFDKVEMFSFTTQADSDQEHDYLLSLEEKFFQTLKIPYQVIKMCSGDLGAPAARKYDIEAWMPGQNQYREVTSTSTTTDFQSRRLNIRYKNKDKLEFVHALNGTACAVGRTIIAILENYQQPDGSIKVPQALQEYLGKNVLLPRAD